MTTTVNNVQPSRGEIVTTWSALANGEAGDKASLLAYADKTVQVFGTFGAGGSVTIQGSSDGTNWATLTDNQGSDLTFTAAGIAMIIENTRYIRPNCTAGDGTTSLSISISGTQ